MAKNGFIDNLLQTPSYGWANEQGELIVPSQRELWREAFSSINVFKDKRNWISLCSLVMICCMLPFAYFFFTQYFSWKLVALIVFYSMVIMGTHGTIWYHRYCTHKAYKFSHPLWRVMTQNLVIKTFPEEMYVLSHHVHHVKSDEPGDPYNPRGGFMYCMLSEFNHHSINKNLSEADYRRAAHFMAHSGVDVNTYEQYRKWGSVATPLATIGNWALNWSFWFVALYLIGGPALPCALFTAAAIWHIGVRAFNYTGHGKGEEKHQEGIDFDRSNLSINQLRPGLLAGEWHNNHHLYPGSARAGFLPSQIDLAWIYIWTLHRVGMVSSYKDSKAEFMRKYLNKEAACQTETVVATASQAVR